MGFYQAFGAGRLSVDGDRREIVDYVVPNGRCDDTSKLKCDLAGYQNLPTYVSKNYQKVGLLFSREVGWGGVGLVTSVYQDGSGRTAACVGSTEDGVEHYYLAQNLRHALASAKLSVVRDFGEWCHPILDTRRSDFPLGRLQVSKPELEADAFREAVRDYDGFSSDFVADFTSLCHVWQDNYTCDLVGTAKAATPLWKYFASIGSIRAGGLFPDGLEWTRIAEDGKTLLASRELPDGKAMYLTREGFAQLRKNRLVVLRATKKADESRWERLSVLWTPEEINL